MGVPPHNPGRHERSQIQGHCRAGAEAARASARRVARHDRSAARRESRPAPAAGLDDGRACDAAAEERAGAGARRGDDRPPEGDGAQRMTDRTSRVSVRILEKEYQVACLPEERSELLDSAEYLNVKMREIRDAGNIVGLDRIAVMAALNLAHELLKLRGRGDAVDTDVSQKIRQLRERVESALSRGQQLEL